MNVLFVTRGFPSSEDVMNGNYEAVQAKAIAAQGCSVSVMSIKWLTIRYFYKRSRMSHRVVDGVDVYECTRMKFSTRFWRFPHLDRKLKKLAYKRLFKFYVKEKGIPDIVHAHIATCAVLAFFLKKDYHLPLVITEHWTMFNKPELPEWLRKMSYVYYQADAVICVSQALANSLKEHFNLVSVVVNNMVSDLFFKSPKNNRQDNTFRFVACGAFRTNRNKGFDILVDAFAQAHFPKNVTLSIVGDGPDRAFIEKKIADYDISDQIHLFGVKTPEEVSDIFSNSDCFVLSSRLETFSIVVIEAMAKGLPVIATRSGGPETFLRPEYGILVEKENVGELTDAMRYMKEHYSDYNTDNIKQYCHEHFSQDVIAKQIIDIYNKVLNNN